MVGGNKNKFSDEIYDFLRTTLDDETRKFWDSLYNYYEDFEIYDSTLFSSEPYTATEQIYKNPYLQDENYELLKDKIGNVNLNFYDGNIVELSKKLKSGYDFINLSSIFYYLGMNLNEYKDFVENGFSLNDNGKILTYFYFLNDKIKSVFSNSHYSIIDCDGTYNEGNRALIYKK